MLIKPKRIQLFQSLLRTLAISGLAGGLVWAITHPIWILRESNQIIIEGNQFLSKPVLLSLLQLRYPQSLLQIQPEAIARSLEAQPTIANADVTRQLFPPTLRIQVKERVPVAIAQILLPKGISTPTPKVSIGLLDKHGVWIPIQTYTSQANTLKLPNLKVIGLSEQYCLSWPQLYEAVSRSSVKVIEINCQDPVNLILKTQLGIVHLGAYSPRLPAQIKILDKMWSIRKRVNSSQIAYIDIKNPEAPLVQMNHPKQSVKINTL